LLLLIVKKIVNSFITH